MQTRFSICNTKVSVAYIRIATLKLAWLTLELLMNQELHTCVSMQILTNMSQLADHDSYGPSHLLKSIFFKKVLKPFSPNVGRVAQRKKSS